MRFSIVRSSNGSIRNICRSLRWKKSCRTLRAELKRAGIVERCMGWRGKGMVCSYAVDLIRPRTRLLHDFSGWARAFFTDDFEYEPEARAKFWKDEKIPALLGETRGRARSPARVESRCLRRRFARSRCGRGRESRPADQCDARGDRGPRCGASAV